MQFDIPRKASLYAGSKSRFLLGSLDYGNALRTVPAERMDQ